MSRQGKAPYPAPPLAADPGSKPEFSARLKELWQDPEWRAKQIEHLNKAREKSRKGGIRYGVPDGMRRHQAKWFWRQAKFEATLTIKKLEAAGIISADEEHAKEALHTALTVMRGPQNQGTRLAAAKLVLEYTKAKPAQKQEVTINKAEEWLEAVVADAKAQAQPREDSGA